MCRLLQYALSNDLHILLLSQWLDVCSLGTLDIAISCNTLRQYWINLLQSLRSISVDNMDHNESSLTWLVERGICASRIQMKPDIWWVPGCDLSLLKVKNLLHLGLNAF